MKGTALHFVPGYISVDSIKLSWATATDLLCSLQFFYTWFTSTDAVTLQRKVKRVEWQEYLNILVFFRPPDHIVHMLQRQFHHPLASLWPQFEMRNANDANKPLGKLKHKL